MCTIFYDAEGIIHVDYLPHKQCMTGSYYADLLRCLRQTVLEKRRGKLRVVPLLLHDNTPRHTADVAKCDIRECGFEQLQHSPLFTRPGAM